MQIKVEFDDAKWLAALAKAPEEISKASSVALKDIGVMVVKEAQNELGRHFKANTGRAQGSIRSRLAGSKAVDIFIKGVDYAVYLHEGTRKHWVEPVNKKALHWGQYAFSKGHEVEGIKGHPFITIAGITCQAEANKRFNEALEIAYKNAGLK